MEYIRSLESDLTDDGCFLCRYWREPEADGTNHVVWRKPSTFVVMNRFPYSNGHLLVSLSEHKSDMSELTEDELLEMTRTIRDSLEVLRATLQPQGFNVGYNVGRCAGAGLPGHLHAHVVPRWSGDTNFMAVIGGTRIVPDSLDALYVELQKSAAASGLRR